MKIAIIGDIHTGVRGSLQVFADQQRQYFLEEFWPAIDDNGIDSIICSGDLFDKRKNIDFRSLKEVKEHFFDELVKRNIKLYIIPGNHDVAYKNTNSLNSLDLLLSEYKSNGIVDIIHDPTCIEFPNMLIGFVPWINTENYEKSVKFINENTDLPLLIGHFEMVGLYELSSITEGLSTELFSDYEQVISGHYHTPIKQNNIWYPGSPLEFTWSDYGQSKGFVILDTKERTYTKIPTKTKMFHKVFYDDTEELQLKKMRKDFPKYANKYVKVVVRHSESRTKLESWINDLYTKGKPYDVSVVDVTMNTELTSEEMRIESLSTMEIIDNTIDSMILDVEKDDLKSLFSDLYKEALQMEL